MGASRVKRPRRREASPREVTLALSHALRTPLTSLALGLGLLDDGVLGALNEGQRDVIRTLVGEVARLAAFVDQKLDTGPLGPYVGPAPRVRIDLADLVRTASAPIERQAAERDVALRGRWQAGVHVLADPVKLGWVAVSLMGNALRYSPAGAPIDVEVAATLGEARLIVRDHGPGLAAGVEARIFDRGGGSGLFLAREIIEGHGGRIAASSPRGDDAARGTTFTITLPLAPEDDTRGEP
jgi:signal transduction histidine kinase